MVWYTPKNMALVFSPIPATLTLHIPIVDK
jgi:hypothetical protein